ncbi:hypothetical protein LCGC14_0581830 [marine sediment metagenome]|uniref:Uncharacterized protein n=1 Tax=marine sediment metagenome TaxID=412755 RepID=A0A0F9UPH4_9ZZZZ
MSEYGFRGLVRQGSVTRVNDGSWVGLRALRDGAAVLCPWYQALVLEGRCFSAAAPGTYDHAGLTVMATYADTSKTVAVDIPDATAGIPLYMEGSFLATGGAVVHASGMVNTALNGTGGTETEISELNLRLDNPVSSGATAMHTVSSAVDNVDGTERVLFHFATSQDLDAVALDPRSSLWSIGEVGLAPVVLDASSINLVMFTTTSGTGFGLVAWAELPESAIT